MAEMSKYRVTNGLVLEDKIFDVLYIKKISKKDLEKPVEMFARKIPVMEKTSIIKIVNKMARENFPFVMIKEKGNVIGIIYLEDVQKALKFQGILE